MDTYQTTVEMKLTQDQWEATALELARLQEELALAEAKKSKMVATCTEQIKDLKAEIAVTTRHVKTRRAPKLIRVYDQVDLNRGIAETIALESGEVVNSRVLTAQERFDAAQVALPNVVALKAQDGGGHD